MVDAVILLVLVLAILIGLRQGLVRPLVGEASFLVAILLSVQFHGLFEALVPKVVPRFLVGFIAVVALSFALGLAARPLVNLLRRLPIIRQVDVAAGVLLHGLLAFVLTYVVVGAVIDFDSHVYPMLVTGSVTVQQIQDYRHVIFSNPITRAYAGGERLDEAQREAQQAPDQSLSLASFQRLAQILDLYVTEVREPMLRSRLAPLVNRIGGHLPIVGHPRPYITGAPTAQRRLAARALD